MTIKTVVGKLVPGVIGISAGIGWWWVSRMPVQMEVASPEALFRHWCVISVYLGLLFGIAALLLLFAFRKRLSLVTVLLTSLNVLTAWGLVTLFFVASDPLVRSEFVRLGLGKLQWILLVGGILWSATSFYIFGSAIDAYRKNG